MSNAEFENLVDENFVELDGYLSAYMEIPIELPDGQIYVNRIVYRVFSVNCRSDEAAKAEGEKFLNRLRSLMTERCKDFRGVIWWRTRPAFHSGRFYCRLGTSLDLTASQWKWLAEILPCKDEAA